MRDEREYTWNERAAGSGGTDRDRPNRIGANLGMAYVAQDGAKIRYYEMLMVHMDNDDRAQAVRGCDERVNAHRAGTAGADHGYQKFRAECERLGLR